MKLLRYIIIFIVLLVNSLYSYSQPEETISTRDHIFLGGYFSLMLGTYTQIEISPYAGWRFTPAWWVGTGIIYQYYGGRDYYGRYSTSIYGINIFSKYTLVRDFPSKKMSIFTYIGYEALSLENLYFSPYSYNGRFIMQSILIGGGIRQYLGGRASAEIMLLFNINPAKITPYHTPNVRIGFNF
jgi:hypothetical protein